MGALSEISGRVSFRFREFLLVELGGPIVKVANDANLFGLGLPASLDAPIPKASSGAAGMAETTREATSLEASIKTIRLILPNGTLGLYTKREEKERKKKPLDRTLEHFLKEKETYVASLAPFPW